MSVCLCVLWLTTIEQVLSMSSILNTTDLIERAGYRSEKHDVVTEDGFKISVFRVPGAGVPVVLKHGLFVASDSWVIRGKGHDLAFLLADLGYDVWLADSRGNYYSHSHQNYTPEDSAFWDFSVDEMGALDLPAVIDLVLNTTGHHSLVYIGHSLGTTMMYVMSELRPEYVSKVRLMVGMAPTAYLTTLRAAVLRALLEISLTYSTDLIERAGYRSEKHDVVTEDGFKISVFRVPGAGVPVVLKHGLFVASDSWVIRGKGHDLAFLLADLGYDVWLADSRGNYYSHSHQNFTPEESAFWDFSVEEMGALDLPAVIDLVLNTTGHHSLVYIGHSLGTTMMYVMSELRPEYVSKVRLMVGMAPTAYLTTFRAAVLRALLEISLTYSELFNRVGVNEVFPRYPFYGTVSQLFCGTKSPAQQACLRFMSIAVGLGNHTDFSHVNKTYLPEFASHVFSGTSSKVLVHLAQFSKSGCFCKYDYGRDENMKRYGLDSPPDFDLSKTTMPVLHFQSVGDEITDTRDVAKLNSQLPNLIGNVVVDNPLFNHMDYIWADNAKQLVYRQIINTIVNYS